MRCTARSRTSAATGGTSSPRTSRIATPWWRWRTCASGTCRPARAARPRSPARTRPPRRASIAASWMPPGASSPGSSGTRYKVQWLQWRGGRVILVDAGYTSRTCRVCAHESAQNRKTQALLVRVACGHTENADVPAARNILARGIALFEAARQHDSSAAATAPSEPPSAAGHAACACGRGGRTTARRQPRGRSPGEARTHRSQGIGVSILQETSGQACAAGTPGLSARTLPLRRPRVPRRQLPHRPEGAACGAARAAGVHRRGRQVRVQPHARLDRVRRRHRIGPRDCGALPGPGPGATCIRCTTTTRRRSSAAASCGDHPRSSHRRRCASRATPCSARWTAGRFAWPPRRWATSTTRSPPTACCRACWRRTSCSSSSRMSTAARASASWCAASSRTSRSRARGPGRQRSNSRTTRWRRWRSCRCWK